MKCGVAAWRSRWLALVLCLALDACGSMPGAPLWNAPDFSALARKYGPAVVNISAARNTAPALPAGADDATLGSGFIVSADGYILTNAHVVTHGARIVVKLTADVALLKIDARGLPTVRIGDPSSVDVGDWALAIGSPFGFSNSATAGIVSAKRRILPGVDYTPFLQTDVPVTRAIPAARCLTGTAK